MDRLVEGGEREEPAVAQARQNPSPDDLDADFDLGLVARPIRPCGNDGSGPAYLQSDNPERASRGR